MVGQAPLPAEGFVRGTRFVVQSLCGLGLVSLGAVEPQCAVASSAQTLTTSPSRHRTSDACSGG